MKFLDGINQNYLAWTWNNWGCGGPSVIASDNGKKLTKMGKSFLNHIKSQTKNFGPVPNSPNTPSTPINPSTSSVTFKWYPNNNDYWTVYKKFFYTFF